MLPCEAAYNHTIYVDSRSGVNNATCLSSEGLPCRTLEYAVEKLQSNTRVVIVPPGHQLLSRAVRLSRLQNITISGSDEVILYCNDTGDAGLTFDFVQNLLINNVVVENCGTLQGSGPTINRHPAALLEEPVMFRSAVYISNCTDVMISDCKFAQNAGIGVTIFNSNGLITIESCSFTNNSVPHHEQSEYPGGGGLYIEQNNCTFLGNGSDFNCEIDSFVEFMIRDTNFSGNTATRLTENEFIFPNQKELELSRLGDGAGLSIALRKFTSRNCFTIQNCIFEKNRAFLGGAIAIQIDDSAVDNTIKMDGGIVSFNTAVHGGGGIEFGFFSFQSMKSNGIEMKNYRFDNNQALYGGGVGFYSTRMHSFSSPNTVLFSNCSWSFNSAAIGAAIVLFPDDFTYISGGYLPVPKFHNCNFHRNRIASFNTNRGQFQSLHASQLNLGGGIIYSDTFSLNISGNVTFTHNTGSCIHISAAQINVLDSANLTMDSNYARKGAGLLLMGYASLMVCENSAVSFINNTAEDSGGGLYYDTVDLLEFFNSRRCFIRYSELTSHQNWITNFTFVNNTAGKYGHAIYATSLLPCARANSLSNSTERDEIKKLFVGWQQFNFEPLEDYTITTDPAVIHFNKGTIEATPGNRTELGITILDDLDQTMDTVLFASCGSTNKKDCQSISLEGAEYVTNNETIIRGSVLNQTVTLKLNTVNNRPIGIDLNVTLRECAPGYYLNGNECECSTSNSSHKLPGIVACDEQLQTGYLEVGYWTGLYDGMPATAECPPGYCDYPTNQYNGFVQLPSDYEYINQLLCTPKNRNGDVCGMCIDNHSVYYHSDRFKCQTCDYPELGPLFYVLSELLPVTIIFIFVIVFDINLMSGVASSFILFAQTLDFFQVTLGSYVLPPGINILTQMYWFLFGFFNLEFFRTDKLSFCIFQNASTLDTLAFKYITTAYGLLLVCLLYILMNVCQCHKIIGKCRKNSVSSQYTVMNGLTAFLVLTYSQCAKVSFELLSQLNINIDGGLADKSVVLLAGHISYFGQQHLKYAVPAMIVLCYLFLVPIFLIGHPLYLLFKKYTSSKIFQKWDDSNQTCSSFTLFTKPILDAFQAPYKDNARFFAGIMFFYRLVISALFALNQTTLTAFSSLEVFLIIVLMARSLIHPYKQRLHNIIESVMFTDLALINGITLYNTVSSQLQTETFLTGLLIVQLVLIYMPIISITAYIAYQVCHFLGVLKKTRLQQYINFSPNSHNKHDETLFDPVGYSAVDISTSFNASHLPARMFENEDEQKKNYGAINN